MDDFVKKETTEFNDVIPMREIERLLKELERDCVENVSGELKLNVVCGEVINAEVVKTTEFIDF